MKPRKLNVLIGTKARVIETGVVTRINAIQFNPKELYKTDWDENIWLRPEELEELK